MTLSRRSLLAMLALAVADPERLIWQPAKKLISIPAAPRVAICKVCGYPVSREYYSFADSASGL